MCNVSKLKKQNRKVIETSFDCPRARVLLFAAPCCYISIQTAKEASQNFSSLHENLTLTRVITRARWRV